MNRGPHSETALDVRRCLLQIASASRRKMQVNSFAREFLCDCKSDALAAARYDCGLPLQPQIHGVTNRKSPV
jgi:hypothetical protein